MSEVCKTQRGCEIYELGSICKPLNPGEHLRPSDREGGDQKAGLRDSLIVSLGRK